MDHQKNFKALLSLFSIYIVWGTTYLAIRIGVKDLPPVLFTGLRWLAAGPIMFLIMKISKHKLPSKNDLKHLAIIGLLLLGGGNGFVVFAEQWVPSGITALLITTVPFWVVGIESFYPQRKKINTLIIIGIILGMIGVLLIFGGDLNKIFDESYLKGVIGLMVAVFLWSIGTVYSKHKKVSVHPLMGAAVEMIIAGIVITILGILLGETNNFNFSSESFLAYTYLVVFGSLIGYGSYIYAIAHLPISLVSTYAYVNPIIALFLGWLVLNEPINIWIIFSSIIILVGVALIKKGSENY